ncbi:MAG: magnesium transporter CorA family protein [Acetobacteraceae bacterium]|nr:magnesium transporter CorA family protein [Acetobacteraceae bacterium]
MLRCFARDPHRPCLVPAEPRSDPAAPGDAGVVWYDLRDPTAEERAAVEAALGLSLPTREEMGEIEISSRLYQEDGGEFMTVTGLAGLDTDEPVKDPITFILKGDVLVTIRHANPRPFDQFLARAQKPGGPPAHTGEQVMLGILEAMIDRLADALEVAGSEVDALSREIFRKRDARRRETHTLEALIERIGRKGDLLTLARESLVSIARMATYHAALETEGRKPGKDARARVKVIQRDVASLSDHATFLSQKINFMLDATLGLINLEQAKTIKIFSVAAVIFLPPTLVASVYGMNFEHMPELQWQLGYPWALGLMLASAVVPYLFFKKRGWL